MRSMFGLLLASAILAFRSSAIAAPGDPFGGDDAGCVPPTAAVGRCEDGVQKALTKYIQTVIKCHIKAADAAVNSMPFDEELCESDPSTAKGAKERYDAANREARAHLQRAVRGPQCAGAAGDGRDASRRRQRGYLRLSGSALRRG